MSALFGVKQHISPQMLAYAQSPEDLKAEMHHWMEQEINRAGRRDEPIKWSEETATVGGFDTDWGEYIKPFEVIILKAECLIENPVFNSAKS